MSNLATLAAVCGFTFDHSFDIYQEDNVYYLLDKVMNFPRKKATKLISGTGKIGVNFSGVDGYVRVVNRKAYIRVCDKEEQHLGEYEEIALVMKEQYEGLFEPIMNELHIGKYDKNMKQILYYIIEEMFQMKQS
jgi:hypothetical protein